MDPNHELTQENAREQFQVESMTTNYIDESKINMINNNKDFIMTDKLSKQNDFLSEDNLTKNKAKMLKEIWTKDNFNNHHRKMNKNDLNLNLKCTKMSWTNNNNNNNYNKNNRNDEIDDNDDDMDDCVADGNNDKDYVSPTPSTPDDKESVTSPSHHARRPMNAFLIFCKKHRPIVRKKFPTLENRGVTRILGEWWALLDNSDKESYTTLAKEYKDAFFSANPNFKWYKLPAPPLRTLTTRPLTVQREISPLSPTEPLHQHHNNHHHQQQTDAQFTPGKLADESQLGKLSSLLLNSDYSNNKTNTNPNNGVIQSKELEDKNFNNNNNNIDNNFNDDKNLIMDYDENDTENVHNDDLPLTPLKRNFYDDQEQQQNVDNNNQNNNNNVNSVSLKIDNNQEILMNDDDEDDDNNMTKQELVEKVVDSMFLDDDYSSSNHNVNNGKVKTKETRKSTGRACKGKRYEQFMVNGKLLKNKREKKSSHEFINKYDSKFESELSCKLIVGNNDFNNGSSFSKSHHQTITTTPKLDLDYTIKRLAERTNTKLETNNNNDNSKRIKLELNEANNSTNKEQEQQQLVRIMSKSNDNNNIMTATTTNNADNNSNYQNSYFNLELRIAELPFLSYDNYIQRKRDSKKKKQFKSNNNNNKMNGGGNNNNLSKIKGEHVNKSLVGSKKRKNKNNITHLDKNLTKQQQDSQKKLKEEISLKPSTTTTAATTTSASATAATDDDVSSFTNDLSGLATLAEIAAITEKIN